MFPLKPIRFQITQWMLTRKSDTKNVFLPYQVFFFFNVSEFLSVGLRRVKTFFNEKDGGAVECIDVGNFVKRRS